MAQQKKIKQKVNWRKATVMCFAVYVLCQLLFGFSSVVELQQQKKELAAELEAAYAEQAELQEHIRYMQSEEAIEKTAREKLGLIKEGEILIRRAAGE